MSICPNYAQYRDAAWCPGSIKCVTNATQSLELSPSAAYLAIISSTFSCLGSILIVFSYCRWKDIRTGSRSVITFLAIADFITAFGYIFGSVNYLVHFKRPVGSMECAAFKEICEIQSFITSSSSVSSFLWTTALALYLYITLVHSKIVLANKLMPYFHVIGWGFPILLCFPLLATHTLGYSPVAVSTWCYIHESYTNVAEPISVKTIALVFVAGKFWEILTYIVIIVLYISIKCYVRKEAKSGESENYLSSGLVAAVRKADTKLMFIPILFILLRCWGTFHFLFSLIVSSYIHCGCVSPGLKTVFNILGYLQAIGDGGQGWGNVLLYVIASTKIRRRLFGWIVTCLQSASDNTATADPIRAHQRGVARHQHQLSKTRNAINEGAEVNYRSPVVGDFPRKPEYGGTGSNASIQTHEPTTDYTNDDRV